MNRGEIWWADLPPPTGSGPGDRRPVVIVQADCFNHSRIATIVVVPLTSNLRLAEMPGNTLIPRDATGLRRECVANASLILAIDRHLMTELAGAIPRPLMKKVEEGMKLVLGL